MMRKIGRLATQGRLNVVDVTLKWHVKGAVAAGYNSEIEATWGAAGVVTEQEQTIKAFFHTVSVGTTTYQKYEQVEKGDVILDFIGELDLAGRGELRFVVDGKTYVQKDGGAEMAKTSDAWVDGIQIFRSVLVAPVGGPGA